MRLPWRADPGGAWPLAQVSRLFAP